MCFMVKEKKKKRKNPPTFPDILYKGFYGPSMASHVKISFSLFVIMSMFVLHLIMLMVKGGHSGCRKMAASRPFKGKEPKRKITKKANMVLYRAQKDFARSVMSSNI